MDDQFLINKSEVRDFTSTTLAAITKSVQKSFECCRHEIFQRVMETPLAIQADDLSECLQGMPGPFAATVANWRRMESYRILPPGTAPDYLKELFFSNLRALLEILDVQHSSARSSV